MSCTVGCLTEISTRVIHTGKPMNVRLTIEQDWFLHSTKGWRRGPKRKHAKPVTWGQQFQRWSFHEVWRAWKR